MGNDFYVMALESQIGTLVDGQPLADACRLDKMQPRKIRHHDGPVPLRDGTTLGVGRLSQIWWSSDVLAERGSVIARL